MDPRDPLPPDPYAALGVPRDATQAIIKTAYRKAALKCHPDKVPGKGDEFHRISVAYELIGEEESRSKYDADLRLRELKKEQQARFGGGGYPASPGVRNGAFDPRGSPRQGFQFSERTAPRYETSERRPPPQYASTPKATSYERESSRGDYFGRYETYDAPPPRKTSGAKTPFREEERKTSKKEKVDPKQKLRDETKKTRDKTRGYDRKTKTKTESLVDSDSESEYDNPRKPRQENVRAAYVRPKQESSRRSDDDDRDYFSRRQENMRTYSVKDYISKAKTEGPPIEKGAPPPAYAANGGRRQARSPSPSPPLRERERDDDIRSPKIRSSRGEPEIVRRSSDKPSKEKEKAKKESAKSTSARPAMARTASSRRSPPPEREHRPTSRLQHADTAPPSRLHIPEDAEIRRGKAESYRQEDPRVPPMRRSETVPKPSRHGDTTPIQSSGLRNMKTNDDSGYSTSSPSEDTPPQPAKQYRYEADREERVRPSMRDRRESARSPERDLDRDRRLPSEKERDRARGPPVSRSGSYAFDVRNSDPEARPPQARRPSLQRRGSEQDRRGSTRDDPPRRPPVERADSVRGSSNRVPQVVPDLPRGKTMPTVRTGFNDPRERSSSDARYFGEIPHVSSPVNAHSDDSDFDELPSRMRRGVQRDIPHRHVMRDMDSGYGTSYGNGYGMPQGRRASEDYEKKMEGASRYMDQATERPLPRRTATYAGLG